ncbi:MAG: GrpB family protein [Clostridia bacterium]|nr:GrpB family protein [Clostridia bacterium]
MIEITEYNPKWADDFSRLKAIYLKTIQSTHIKVEHIGSTSIKDLCAKPVIDVVIIYYNQGDLPLIINNLLDIGYEHRGDRRITGREAFRYRGTCLLPAHNLYVCLDGITALENQIKYRDYLINHPDDKKAYGELKKALAEKYSYSRDKYCAAKTEFIIDKLRKCGLSEEKLNDIIEMNRI